MLSQRLGKILVIRQLVFLVICVLFPEMVSAGVAARYWQLDEATPFMRAAQEGNVAKVQEMLRRGENVNQQAKSGATPLIFAASRGKVEVVRLLLEHRADPNLCAWEDVCPIWYATVSNSYDTVKVLIEAGGKVNKVPGVNSLEQPTLQQAVSAGRIDIVKLLLDHGIDVDYTNFFSENTALAAAVRAGQAKIAQLLIERGADLGEVTEVPYNEGRTALELAKKDGHTAAVAVVESALRSGKYKRPKYSVKTIIDKLYHDPNFDLSTQGADIVKFLRRQSKQTLRYIRNTIFARKNYHFDDAELVEYFRQKFPSYKPIVRTYDMSDVDKRNVQFMKEVEGYRAAREAAD